MKANNEQPHEQADPNCPGRIFRVLAASFVALVSLVSCSAVMINQPSWPAAFAVAAELLVVTVFCRLMLRKNKPLPFFPEGNA